MIKWYLYIDYGSGYTLLTPYDLSTSLSWKVDDNINPGVKRKSLSGSFKLLGTEAQAAFTYFITNGNQSAPFRIYENGISGVGTLEFEGTVNISAEYNNRESIVTFTTFETADDYSSILSVWKDDSTIVESLSLSNDFNQFYSQGQHTNCSKLQAYSLSGSTWATTGNALSLGDVGRIAMDNLGSSVCVYDNLTKEIRRYIYSAPNWSLSTLGTSYDVATQIGVLAGNGAICAVTSTQIAFIDDYHSQLQFMTATTGTYTVNASRIIEDINKPSLALITTSGTTYIAMIDNKTKVLRAYNTSGSQIGNSLSLGDLENPNICTLDAGANARIALCDTKTNSLRAYTFDGSNFTELPTAFKLPTLYEPQMTQESVNNITVIDAISGFMARYSFSGTSWSQTGSNTTISGGYMGACGYEGTYMGTIQSDCFALQTSRTVSYYELTNAVLNDFGLGLSIPSLGHGATFDLDDIYIGEMSNLQERNKSGYAPINYTKFKLKDLLEFPQMFQNYWYISGSNILFTQPASFSSAGTNFSIDSLQRGGLYVKTENDQESYREGFNIGKEKLIFNNERTIEFVGQEIDYQRDNENEIVHPFSYTADFEFIVDFFTGQSENLNKSGLFIAYINLDADSGYRVISDTGVLGSSDTRNNYLSKSQIMESHWKDYRYSSNSNFLLNGNIVAPQNTVRDIVRYTTLELDYSDIGITGFPSSVGNLTWDTGVKVGYIYEFTVDMDARKIIIDTGLLDL